MTYKKKHISKTIVKATSRLDGVNEIDKNQPAPVNYGNDNRKLNGVEYKAQIEKCGKLTEKKNQLLENADITGNELKAEEKILAGMTSEILSSAKGKFGSDSNEVEQLGGTRKSDRKKRTSKKQAAVKQ